MRLHYIIPIDPVACQRARVNTRTNRLYTPQKTRDFKEAIQFYIRQEKELIDEPVVLTAKFYFKRPKRRIIHGNIKTTKPDLDNLIKGVQDALNGHVWRDDALVWSYGLGTGKYYDTTPRVELWIDKMTP